MEETAAAAQRRRSRPSSGYGTPADMKPPCEQDMRGWQRMKGRRRQSRNARWPFWVSPRDPPHTSPLPRCLFSCLLVTSLSALPLQCDVDLFTFVSRFISTSPTPTPAAPLHPFFLLPLLLVCPPYRFSLARRNNRYVEKRSGLMYHCRYAI